MVLSCPRLARRQREKPLTQTRLGCPAATGDVECLDPRFLRATHHHERCPPQRPLPLPRLKPKKSWCATLASSPISPLPEPPRLYPTSTFCAPPPSRSPSSRALLRISHPPSCYPLSTANSSADNFAHRSPAWCPPTPLPSSFPRQPQRSRTSEMR